MKDNIHPPYHQKTHIACACGKTYTFGGTVEKIQLEICANCHPFFTGKEKLIDTAGKVEKFKARREKAASAPKKVHKVRVRKTKG